MSNRRFRATKAIRTGSSRRELIKGIAILAVVVAGVGTAIGIGLTTSGGGHRSASPATSTTLAPAPRAQQQAASQFSDAIDADFRPMEGVLVGYLQTTEGWEQGSKTDSELTAEIQNALPEFAATESALTQQSPFRAAPQALDDYRQAVALYIQSAAVLQAGQVVPADDLRNQIDLSSTRIRDLGDRIFDQATLVLTPYQANSSSPDVTVEKPADVPVWASLGLAVGPPLDSATPRQPAVAYQANRPQQSVAGWKRAVARSGIPTVAEEVAAITTPAAGADRTVSDQFDHAVSILDASPDPAGQRPVSTRLRLGLLVDAEATRAAEEAALAGSPAATGLDDAAKALAAVGDDLWPAELGRRGTGYRVILPADAHIQAPDAETSPTTAAVPVG